MKKYDNIRDEILVEAAQQGDSLAEEAIMSRYKETVKSKARLYFIIGADHEDVVQEGMIGLFKAVKGYQCDRGTTFKTFAELCINRQLLTAIQSAARKKHSPLNNSISLHKPVDTSVDGGPGETLENTIVAPQSEEPEEITILRDAIDKIFLNAPSMLSKLEGQVWSRYLQGKDYIKIAEELSKPPKAIDNALQRIKNKISVFLNE